MKKKHIYSVPPALGKKVAETDFESGNADTICRALLGIALHHPDRRWVEDWCIRLSVYPDQNVRSLTATCIGHLARLHGHLSQKEILPVLESLLKNDVTAGYADDALEMISTFLKEDTGAYEALHEKYKDTLPVVDDLFKQ